MATQETKKVPDARRVVAGTLLGGAAAAAVLGTGEAPKVKTSQHYVQEAAKPGDSMSEVQERLKASDPSITIPASELTPYLTKRNVPGDSIVQSPGDDVLQPGEIVEGNVPVDPNAPEDLEVPPKQEP